MMAIQRREEFMYCELKWIKESESEWLCTPEHYLLGPQLWVSEEQYNQWRWDARSGMNAVGSSSSISMSKEMFNSHIACIMDISNRYLEGEFNG